MWVPIRIENLIQSALDRLGEIRNALDKQENAIRDASEAADANWREIPGVIASAVEAAKSETPVPETPHEDQKTTKEGPEDRLQRKFLFANRLTAWATVAAFVAAGIYACIANHQLAEMKKTTEAAICANQTAQAALRQSRDQFIKDQRPYLWLTNDLGPILKAPHSPGNTSDKLACNFHFMNYGKTPAINVQIESGILFDPRSKSTISYKSLDPKVGSIIPPTKDGFNTAFSAQPVDDDLAKRANTPGLVLPIIVHGLIQYSDTAGNLYTSEFCFERKPCS
jgi:hypothetical protein